jgi:hypothetical protein
MMRAQVLLLLGVVACGFLPEDDFTGKRAGDGIAPWADLGPAQVCLGGQYLGPPDSPPGGLCFDENVVEAPCTGDDQCRSREACVCGRCTVPYCSSASDCAPGRTCSFSERRCDLPCFDGDDCPDGAECTNGVCRGRCVDARDCQTGEVCNSRNFCVTDDCADDTGCLTGERCRVQRTPRQVLEPSPILEGGSGPPRIVLYLEVADAQQRSETAIWRAVSSDGRRFTMSPAQPVLVDGTTARAPSVVRGPGGWVMYYEQGGGAELRVATSADGVAWSAPSTALVGGAGPTAKRAPAAVLLPDGAVAVYYQLGDGAALGLATGAPGGPLTDRGPVLEPRDVRVVASGPGRPFWEDIERITSPFAALTASPAGPSLRLWFSAYGRESGDSLQFGEVVPIPPNHSIGYAAAEDNDPTRLRAWPYGPVVDRVSAFLRHHEELAPGVLQLPGARGPDDAFLMYYVDAVPADGASGPGGPFVIGRLGVLGNGAYSAIAGP